MEQADEESLKHDNLWTVAVPGAERLARFRDPSDAQRHADRHGARVIPPRSVQRK